MILHSKFTRLGFLHHHLFIFHFQTILFFQFEIFLIFLSDLDVLLILFDNCAFHFGIFGLQNFQGLHHLSSAAPEMAGISVVEQEEILVVEYLNEGLFKVVWGVEGDDQPAQSLGIDAFELAASLFIHHKFD